MNIKQYITDHFNGFHPLWLSYWINGWVVNLVAYMTILPLFAWLLLPINNSVNAVLVVGNLAVVPIMVWSYIGIWLSANNYLKRSAENSFFNRALVVFIKISIGLSLAGVVNLIVVKLLGI